MMNNKKNIDEIDLSIIVRIFINFFKYLYSFKYQFFSLFIIIGLCFYIFAYYYNKQLDRVISSRIILLPPSSLNINNLGFETVQIFNNIDSDTYNKKEFQVPNISKFYISILTNNQNFDKFLKENLLDKKSIELKVDFRVPLFEDRVEINANPTEPRIFIDLIFKYEHLKNSDIDVLKFTEIFNNYYEAILENELKKYFLNQVNIIKDENELQKTSILNVMESLNNIGNDSQYKYAGLLNTTINLFKDINPKISSDSFNFFQVLENIEKVELVLLKCDQIITKLNKQNYSYLYEQKIFLTIDLTKYIKIHTLFIILFVFISFLLSFLYLINFSFFQNHKK